jgi:hypothetical protein
MRGFYVFKHRAPKAGGAVGPSGILQSRGLARKRDTAGNKTNGFGNLKSVVTR